MEQATGQGEVLKAVVPWDPAIIWPNEKEAREKAWKDYNGDRVFERLSFKEGTRPQTFTTRRLRSSEMADVDSIDGEPRRYRVAFACGVKEVLTPAGETLRPASGRWTEDEMERFGYAAHNDIGAVILTRSRLPLGLPVSFVLPPTSVAALVAFHFPSAAPSQDGADPSKRPPAEPSGT